MNTDRLNHTDARGAQPFDQNYGLGYQVGHSDWSPFPRVNRLRRVFLDRPYDIDVERTERKDDRYPSAIFILKLSRQNHSHSGILTSVAALGCVHSVWELIS